MPDTCWKPKWWSCGYEPSKHLTFLALLLGGYTSYRVVQPALDFQGVESKSGSDIFNDVTTLVTLGTLSYVFGNYNDNFGWLTVGGFATGMYGFAGLAKLPFMSNSLAGMKDWSTDAWIVYGVALVAILAALSYELYQAKHNGVFVPYMVGLGIVALMVMFAYLLYFKNRDTSEFHPHHYQIFYVLSFFTRFPDPLSKFLGGIALGIFTQGIAAYGPARIIEG